MGPIQTFFFVLGIPLGIVWSLLCILTGRLFRKNEDQLLSVIRLMAETVICGAITLVGLIGLAIFGVVKLCCG